MFEFGASDVPPSDLHCTELFATVDEDDDAYTEVIDISRSRLVRMSSGKLSPQETMHGVVGGLCLVNERPTRLSGERGGPT